MFTGYGPVPPRTAAPSQQFAPLCFDSDSAIRMFMQIAETVRVHVCMQIAETVIWVAVRPAHKRDTVHPGAPCAPPRARTTMPVAIGGPEGCFTSRASLRPYGK